MPEKRGNINLAVDTVKSFTINGDENRVVEFDTSDYGIIERFSECLDRMDAAAAHYESIKKDDSLTDMAEKMKKADEEMYDIIDYIFDSKLARIALNGKSPFAPAKGKGMYKFEEILIQFLSQCEKDLQKGFEKINKAHVNKHTGKYTKK